MHVIHMTQAQFGRLGIAERNAVDAQNLIRAALVLASAAAGTPIAPQKISPETWTISLSESFRYRLRLYADHGQVVIAQQQHCEAQGWTTSQAYNLPIDALAFRALLRGL